MTSAIAAAILASGLAAAEPARLTNAQLAAFLHQDAGKPGKISSASAAAGDLCVYANDLECDEPDIGTGACPRNTDYSDCRYLREGETDTCRWANDGECDEPGLGTGVCTQGTDRSDCAGVAHLRFRTDSCPTAFNGVCEEEGTRLRTGPAICAPRTDRADCMGRKRPLTINDHFQGYDDRVLLDSSVAPWSAIGQLTFEDGSVCTGTLVAPDVVLTAAHCIHDEDGAVRAAGVFTAGIRRAGGPETASIVAYFAAPRFSPELFFASNKLDGTDWAYLRIDRPLGNAFGVLPITPLSTLDGVELSQAGYSWDTDGRLSGHIGCQAIALNADGTLEHVCDTTRGDSGSPLMVVRDGVYGIVAVDSNFRSITDGPPINIATRALGFARYLDDVAAGRAGTPVAGGRKAKPAHARIPE